MQDVNAAFQAELDKGQDDPRIFIDCLEFYPSTTLPGVDGFDPTDAIETFAGVEITWNGIAYRREFDGRGEVSRSIGEKTNSASLTFSNISRYMATWAQTQPIEGLILVIRTINPDVTDDSVVQFVGRCDKPGDIDKKQFPLTARQDFGNINLTLPTSRFLPEDPNGRLPGDVLYEGFRILSPSGTFQNSVPSTSFFGSLFGRKKKVTEQWSAFDLTEYGNPVPEIFGTCQMPGKALIFSDRGNYSLGLWVWAKGPNKSITNFAIKSPGYTMFGIQNNHLGDLGGTGTNAIEDSAHAPGIGYFSLTAYSTAGFLSEPSVVDEAPTVVALIQGRLVDLPDASGVYNRIDHSDNTVHIARFILTNERFCNINPAFMEDSVNVVTARHCDEPLFDLTNSQVIVISSVEANTAGTDFKRYRSSGIYDYSTVKPFSGDLVEELPDPTDGPYDDRDIETEFPTFFPTQTLLRKRYTCNFPITEEVKGVDLLYKTVFPTAKLFMRVNKRGKYEFRTEKASDHTRVRTSTVVGATSIPVFDVTPWKSGPDLLTGRLLTGMGLTTSEVRDIASADYSTSGNAVTLVAGDTGTVTATASGATLTGGSTSVQASGTITIGGTPAPGDTISATIDGIEVLYTLEADTTEQAAAMLAAYINATPRLKTYIRAVWLSASPTVITIYCLHGALNLSSSTGFPTLLKAHAGPIADPTTGPTAVGASGGSLAAGVWNLAYADVTATGLTALTAVTPVTVTLNQQIDVSALPALVGTARNFYLSEQAGSTNLRFVVQRLNASNFSILAAPEPGASLPPSYNTTAEEVIRIAMSFATNSQDVYSSWKPSTLVLLNDVQLPDPLNGHKYQATSITTGITAAAQPTFPTTAGGTVVDGGVTWTEIGSTVLAQAGLTQANIIKDTFKWPMGSTQASINQIKGTFTDRKNDFAKTPFKINDRVKQLQIGGKILSKEVDYSAVDNFHQVSRLGNGELAKSVEGDWFNAFRTYPRAMVLEEGDLICASDDSGGLVNVVTRIEDMGIQSNHEVSIKKARLYSTNMFSDDVGAAVIPIPSTLRYIQTVDSIIAFIDNFAIRDADALIPGFYVAVSRDLATLGDWRGWTLYADYGDGYVALPGAFGDVAATMGTADSILGSVSDPTVYDTAQAFTTAFGTDVLTFATEVPPDGSSVRVSNSGGALPAPLSANTTYFIRDKSGLTAKLAATAGGAAIDITDDGTGTHSIKNVLELTLKYGTPSPSPDPFATVTEADLIANPYKNLFLYGTEYLQAGTVVSNGSQSFTLSDFYRGRFGTDTTQLTHAADEDVVFLNGAEKFVAIDPARAGIAYNYKVVTTNQDVADATPVSFTWNGGTVRGHTVENTILLTDASDDTLIWFEGYDPDADYRVEVWADTDRSDPANLRGTLPVTTGTTHAALLVSDETGSGTQTGGEIS